MTAKVARDHTKWLVTVITSEKETDDCAKRIDPSQTIIKPDVNPPGYAGDLTHEITVSCYGSS